MYIFCLFEYENCDQFVTANALAKKMKRTLIFLIHNNENCSLKIFS